MLPPEEKRSARDDVSVFFEKLRQLHTEPFFVANQADTAKLLKDLVGGAKSVVLAGLPPRVAVVVKSALAGIQSASVEELGPEEAVDTLSRADVGITWAQHGIVEQGALVEVVFDDAQKLASCLPQGHIALVSSKSLVRDLPFAMREIGQMLVASPADRRAVVSFISGPSKTGDIEMRLLYGVHGPLSLKVLVLDWV